MAAPTGDPVSPSILSVPSPAYQSRAIPFNLLARSYFIASLWLFLSAHSHRQIAFPTHKCAFAGRRMFANEERHNGDTTAASVDSHWECRMGGFWCYNSKTNSRGFAAKLTRTVERCDFTEHCIAVVSRAICKMAARTFNYVMLRIQLELTQVDDNRVNRRKSCTLNQLLNCQVYELLLLST